MFEKFAGSIKEKLGRQALAELTIFADLISYEYHILANPWDFIVFLIILSEASINIFKEVPMSLEPDVIVGLKVIISSL